MLFRSSFGNTASYADQIEFKNLQGNEVANAPNFGFWKENLDSPQPTYVPQKLTCSVNNPEVNIFQNGVNLGGYDSSSGYTTDYLSIISDPYYYFNQIPQTSVTVKMKIYPEHNEWFSPSSSYASSFLKLKMYRSGSTPELLKASPLPLELQAYNSRGYGNSLSNLPFILEHT